MHEQIGSARESMFDFFTLHPGFVRNEMVLEKSRHDYEVARLLAQACRHERSAPSSIRSVLSRLINRNEHPRIVGRRHGKSRFA